MRESVSQGERVIYICTLIKRTSNQQSKKRHSILISTAMALQILFPAAMGTPLLHVSLLGHFYPFHRFFNGLDFGGSSSFQ